jgi:hypothetical protein
MKKFMIMAAMLSFAAACGGNTQNEKSEETVETVETVEVVETVETEAVAAPEVEVAVEEKAEKVEEAVKTDKLPAITSDNENLKVQLPEKDKFTVSEIKETKKIEGYKKPENNEKEGLRVSDNKLETPGVQPANLTVKK